MSAATFDHFKFPSTSTGSAYVGVKRMAGIKQGHFWSDHIDFEGMASFLRRVHPTKTAIGVAADTGLPPDSVKKWLAGDVQPNGRAVLALVAAYGPAFLLASLKRAPAWLDDHARETRRAELRAELARLGEG